MKDMITVTAYKNTKHPIEIDVEKHIAKIAPKIFFLELLDIVEYFLHDTYMDVHYKTNPRATIEEIAEYFADKDRLELDKGFLAFVKRQDEVGAATDKVDFRNGL